MEKSKHKDMHDLSKKLQSEIDVLLQNVDEKILYAEFRENEIFDIQNGDKHETIQHTLDERIMLNRKNTRGVTIDRIERTTTTAAEKITGARRFFQYLFKPLPY
jgi:hypothetical protein